MPNNQALFKELTDYTKSYKDLDIKKMSYSSFNKTKIPF